MSAPGLKTAAGSSKISGKFPFGMDVAALLGLFLTTMVRDENKNRQWVKVLLLLLMPCLISVAWLIDRNIKAEALSARWETHTHVVKQELRELFFSVQSAESGQRGFIITGRPSFLDPYHAGLDTSVLQLAELRRLTADNSSQQRLLVELTPLVAQKFADLKMSIALRDEKGLLAASEHLLILSGEKRMDQIRMLVIQAQKEESQLLQDRMAAQTQSTRYTTQSVFLGGTLGSLVLFLLFIYLRWEQVGHHEAQTAQQVSDDQYRSLFNSIDEGFCIIDMVFDASQKPIDYCFLEVNPAFERQTGLRAATGKRMRELVPDHEDEWFAIYGKVALTGESHRFVHEAKALARWFDVYAFRLDGLNYPRVAVLFTDITERRQAKNEILLLNAELEDRVRRRTAQLQAANQELEAFSYSVSHDLRSPLKTIDGFTHLLARTMGQVEGSKGAHYLSRIRAGVQQMGELIDGLLSLARMSRETLHYGSVDLSAIARRAAQDCRDSDPGRQVQMHIQDGMEVYGDARLLLAVIQNLLGNAWKFTSRQDAACIEIGRQAGKGGETIYFVRDNGAGFDMAHADKLFGTFERLHAVSDFSGTGIGLATVKRVIDRHSGRVWAEGKVDEGATFYFTLQLEVRLAA
jgi:PAS domain S-box-containing protein